MPLRCFETTINLEGSLLIENCSRDIMGGAVAYKILCELLKMYHLC